VFKYKATALLIKEAYFEGQSKCDACQSGNPNLVIIEASRVTS